MDGSCPSFCLRNDFRRQSLPSLPRLAFSSHQKLGILETAQQQLQHIHTPQSIDQELAHLTKDLELTRNSKSKCGLCSRNTRTRFRPCSTRIRQLRGKTLLLRSTQLATKRTARFTRCLQTIRRNWRERCRKLSTTAKKTGDLLRRQQRRRRSYILRPLDEVVLWI